MPSSGALLCLASAVAFGAMGIFGKLAYDEGANVGTLLAARFVLAAALLWAFVLCSRGTGNLALSGVSAQGFGWLAGIAVVSTVGAVGLFFAGLQRVGPTAASILSTLEPVVTVALAFLVFGESLGPTQLAGGALVLLAVLAVRTPVRVAVLPAPEASRASA